MVLRVWQSTEEYLFHSHEDPHLGTNASWDRDMRLWVCITKRYMKESILYTEEKKSASQKKGQSDREWRSLVVKCIWLGTHTRGHSYACMKWPPHGHMNKSHERYLATLRLILTGFLFESLFLTLSIADEPFTLPDFSHIYVLSLKGIHDEGNYSCRLRGILKADDARTFPTFRIQATSWTEWYFISTSSLEPNVSFSFLHDVSLEEMMNKPCVVGPFSLITTGCPDRKKREIPVKCHGAQSTICSWKPDQWWAQVQCRSWHWQASNNIYLN